MEQQTGIQMLAKQRTAGPFWFEWNELLLSGEQPSMIDFFYFPILHVNFHARSILSQSLRFASDFSLWDGEGKAWLILLHDSTAYEYHVDFSLMNLNIVYAELPYVKKGTLSFAGDYQWNQNDPFAGQGQGNFSLESIQIEDLPLRTDVVIPLVISSANGLLSIEEEALTLRDIRIHGEGLSLSGQGHVQIAANMLDSRFEGEGILYLNQEYANQFSSLQYVAISSGQPISLKLMGTVRNPSLEVNGVPIPLEPSLLFSFTP